MDSHAKATCNDCGFHWFGDTSVHALSLVGRCTKCGGKVTFLEDAAALPPIADEPTDRSDVPAHLVMGAPRW